MIGESPRDGPRGNIAYATPEIARHYSVHRSCWKDLYPSEQWAFEWIAARRGTLGKILDVGCAAGGLCSALEGRFHISSYLGVDINRPAIEAANKRTSRLRVPSRFVAGDILEIGNLEREPFNTVVSLGCADWNVDTDAIIRACWNRVAQGGRLVISLRLTPDEGVNDIRRSYQPILFDRSVPDEVERANYAVFEVGEALTLIGGLNPPPGRMVGYGYWGKPSPTAVTPYDRLVFSVFLVEKNESGDDGPQVELILPLSAFRALPGMAHEPPGADPPRLHTAQSRGLP